MSSPSGGSRSNEARYQRLFFGPSVLDARVILCSACWRANLGCWFNDDRLNACDVSNCESPCVTTVSEVVGRRGDRGKG